MPQFLRARAPHYQHLAAKARREACPELGDLIAPRLVELAESWIATRYATMRGLEFYRRNKTPRPPAYFPTNGAPFTPERLGATQAAIVLA